MTLLEHDRFMKIDGFNDPFMGLFDFDSHARLCGCGSKWHPQWQLSKWTKSCVAAGGLCGEQPPKHLISDW